MKTGNGKRLALLAAVLALVALGVLGVVVSTGQFTLRYDVGDLLSMIEEFDRDQYGTEPTPEDIALDRDSLRDLLVQSTAGEERLGAGSLRIEGSALIARVTLAQHWEVWRILRKLRRP